MTQEQYVIVIGSMKSGTTTLFQMLAEHSQIAPAYPKEPGFFAFDDIYAQGFEWYHGLFDFDPATHVYRLDGSTDYTKTPFATGVWDRMTARPGARYKLVYIMRHPLRRFESHARHVQRTRKELGQIVSDRPDHGLDSGVSLPSLAMGRYAAQLDVYADAWAAGDLFLTTLEELDGDPDRVRRALLEFLDLPNEAAPVAPAVKNAARQAQTQPTALLTLTRQPAVAALGKAVMGKEMRRKIKQGLRRSAPIEGRFKLHPEEEAALLALLAPDLRRLQDVYKVDVERLWGMSLAD